MSGLNRETHTQLDSWFRAFQPYKIHNKKAPYLRHNHTSCKLKITSHNKNTSTFFYQQREQENRPYGPMKMNTLTQLL